MSLAALVACTALAVSACGSGGSNEEALNVSGASNSSASATTSGSTDQMGLAQGLSEDESGTSSSTGAGATGTAGQRFSTEDTRADAAPNSALVLTDLRVGEHEGNDRVVFEFSGEGTPGYSISYVSSPSQQGSGRAISVDGSHFLQVMLTGQALPTLTPGTEELSAGPISPQEQTTQVKGVYFAGQFEGVAQAVVGLDAQRAYSAFLLENPTRLVVDIQR